MDPAVHAPQEMMQMTATATQEKPRLVNSIKRRLITTDCHIAPPYALVDELPESYREYFPRLERRRDGLYVKSPRTVISAMMEAMGGGSDTSVKVDDDPRALAKMAVLNVCDGAEPSFDPAEQIADYERDGVYGAVLIGQLAVLEVAKPLAADVAYCELVNDWQAETWGPYLDRVAPGILLPHSDVGASVKELERAAAKGLRPALLPDHIHDRPYYLPEWEPLWEAAERLSTPITMHVGGLRKSPEETMRQMQQQLKHPAPGQAFTGWYLQCVEMGETLGHFTFSGVFERHPKLHVVMTEGYAAWLGFAMQFYDHHWTQSRFGGANLARGPWGAKLKEVPSFYLKRQAHATFMWDPLAIQSRAVTGCDCLLWGNDYPHNEGSFPDSQEWIDKQFAGVPEAEIDAMVRGNAAKLFRIAV
jgi:predicted TIM-barrel fold metal-dependent hydrolase